MNPNAKVHAKDIAIMVHNIGGIGGYGPAEALEPLDDVNWIVFDADEKALDVSSRVGHNALELVNKCIGDRITQSKFLVRRQPSASSLLPTAATASRFTQILSDGSARIWGEHTEIVQQVDVELTTLDHLVETDQIPPADFLSIDAQGAELAILRGGQDASWASVRSRLRNGI